MTKDTSKRLKVMGVGIILVFTVLIAQAFNLQIRQYDNFIQLANNNRIRLIPILAPRGTIYDRNKQAIVATRAANTVSIVPMDLKNEEYVLAKLSYILDMPIEEINKKIAEQTFRPFDPIRLKKDIQLETLAKIEEQKNDLPGVILETVPIREYIYGDLGCHLFGYVGEISQDELKALENEGYKAGDIIGKTGLEKVYDKYLQGVNGGQQVQVNASGKMISIMGEKKIVPGNNLILNIDAKVQKTAENALKEAIGKTPGAKGGAVVAMDPRNGQIIALVSQPGFMPNKFATGISLKDWSSLINDKRHPMKNRVTESAYPPGS
ncbi:MAG: penicillin-binding transpeptidase domain-containing protein, partial [bacterium]